jgi:tetratricopeptide (TPR) repeat protein
MLLIPLLLIVLAAAPSVPGLFREYRLMQEGCGYFDSRSYRLAETKFLELLRFLPEGEGYAAATFNLACTYYMQGKYSQAAALFSRKPDNRELKQKSLYNEGNTLAMTALLSKEKNQKTAFLRNALDRFRSVLIADPKDGEAKINYEIVQRYLQELERPVPPPTSGSGDQKNPQQPSGINQNVAERLLEKVQADESSLMQQLPRQGKTETGGKNDKDW